MPDTGLVSQGAVQWVRQAVSYTFMPLELYALRRFFTNTTQRVFFIFGLPPSVGAALLSMYSRIENARGIRGHFVDNLMPLILLSFSERFATETKTDEELKALVGDMQEFLKEQGLVTLERFISYSDEHYALFREFICASADPKYFEKLASSPRFRWFMALFLDKYGHNSIARGAMLTFGAEGVSILAAKSMEWGRPGAGYIELSTRFVRMDRAELYPFWGDLRDAGVEEELVVRAEENARESLKLYQDAMQDGSLEVYFREVHGSRVPEKELAAAVKGEACDLLGNLLPAATLTSLGVSVSGEAFPELIRHLLLDNTPENIALADFITEEAKMVGGDQFLRHTEVTEAKRRDWKYLSTRNFFSGEGLVLPHVIGWFGDENIQLLAKLELALQDFEGEARMRCPDAKDRGAHDKLPNQFEYFSGFFRGVMSFRGWRDLHRHGFCTHFRTYLTPDIGFYRYDKLAPEWLEVWFLSVQGRDASLYRHMRSAGVLPEMCQYPLALGNMVGFQAGGNLSQWEFVLWQRSKFSVNHEVREITLQMDAALCGAYPLWADIARTDRTPAYLFARTAKGIPYEEVAHAVGS
ncbi:MAG: FAD-dependent thymidylate synthase [Candidatus Brennerbacteria bacterium]